MPHQRFSEGGPMHFHRELIDEEPSVLERLRVMLHRREAPSIPGPVELELLRARMGSESAERAPLPPPVAPISSVLVRHDV
jgi:hypothetical protein